MAFEVLNNNETGAVIRRKINDNFASITEQLQNLDFNFDISDYVSLDPNNAITFDGSGKLLLKTIDGGTF